MTPASVPAGEFDSLDLDELAAEARCCTRCDLAETRTTVVFGAGSPHAPLVLVGEGPGRDEDLAGEPFVGRSGKLLDRLLAEEVGLDRGGCFICNVVMCRPPQNRDPRPDEIAACRPFLERKLVLVAPKVVVTLGNVATRALLETTDGITKVRGRSYPLGAATLVPTYHPAAALRGGGEVMASMRADLVRAKRLLGAAPPDPGHAEPPDPWHAPPSDPGHAAPPDPGHADPSVAER